MQSFRSILRLQDQIIDALESSRKIIYLIFLMPVDPIDRCLFIFDDVTDYDILKQF